MKIIPLSAEYLTPAISLIVKTFKCKPTDFDYPGKWLPQGIAKKKNLRMLREEGVTYLRYFVGLDEKTNKLIGTTGIYFSQKDSKDSAWLSWLCVDAEFRGKGYGTELLNFAINLSKKKRKRFIKLYTSHKTNINRAMKMYKKRGFKIVKIEKNSEERVIYMNCKIN